MFNLFLTTEATTSGAGMLASFLPLILVLVVFYFMLIRPQNKKSKQEAAMRYLDFVYKTKPVFEEHDSTPQNKEE